MGGAAKLLVLLAFALPIASASFGSVSSVYPTVPFAGHITRRPQMQLKKRQMCAVALPGDSIGEDIFVNGFANFANIFQNVLGLRILLSWFPAAQSVGALQPVYSVCDPYLNAFRGILPPLFGIDFSPFLAFATLQIASGSMVALGAPLPGQQASRGQTQRSNLRKNPILNAISLERLIAEGMLPWQSQKK